MEPRWYQSEAVQATWDFIRSKPGNPCIVLPTGAGKSLVIAMMARDALAWGGRVLIIAHRKELLEQNAEKVSQCLPGLDVGIYSAGLGRKDHGQDIVVAGVQSCFKAKAAYNLGHRDVVIVDEAHLIPLDGEGMYRQLLEHLTRINPALRLLGLTATPYRLDQGLVCGPENLLTEISYEVPLTRLIEEGFLCNLTSKDPANLMRLEGVGTRGGDFIQAQLDEAASADAGIVRAAVLELLRWTHDRRSVLLFACGRKHAKLLMDCLVEQVPSDQVAYIDGKTPTGERAETLSRFKAGAVRYLVNIDVLTTGFDAPNVDCVALLRQTLSPGLLYQMVGRGFRLHPDKQNCLVLDFAGNIQRLGPIDQLKPPKSKAKGEGTPGEAPAKSCPECRELVMLQARECSACGYIWPEPEPKHDREASDLPVLSGGKPVITTEWVEVTQRPTYLVHAKGSKQEGDPRTLRVIYKLRGQTAISEYVCLDHPKGSWPRRQAEKWWAARSSVPVPASCWEAWWLLKEVPDALAYPDQMELKWTSGRKWPEVLNVKMGLRPEVDPQALEEARMLAEMKDTLFR